ncbi:competence protein ComEA [Leucobacter komagatae]|uniref:Competence protein ComEA n=1 Tax=Leucobacter komagatae TaxID=55969 RepID=A0A542Y3W9_9MICO|nr:ComEA family DNA-binding protein [Leucobacter komagatae]TQL42763.1 competence protein ComEA [Leucobacter komagatae]
MTKHHLERGRRASHYSVYETAPKSGPGSVHGPDPLPVLDPLPALDPLRDGETNRAASASPGRWERKPGRGRLTDDDPLSWQPELTAWERIRAQLSVPKAAAVVVFAIALIVTAVVMLRALGDPVTSEDSAGSPSQSAPKLETASAGAQSGRDAAGAWPEDPARGAAETKIFVHVVGEVERPGVVELQAGDRVLDAITAAGGATPRAELSAVNLARAVTDGEQIVVLDAEAAAQLPTESAQGNASVPSGGGPGGSAGGGINVNSASVDQLTELPGIGPALGQRIVDWREANGPFTSVEQLTEVSGIGAKTLERFRDRVIL